MSTAEAAVLPGTGPMQATRRSAITCELLGRHLRHGGRQTHRSLGELTGALSENLLAAAEVRAFNLEKAERSRFRGELARFHRASMKAVKYDQATQSLMEFVAADGDFGTMMQEPVFRRLYEKQSG